MSQVTSHEARCQSCGGTIPAGTRVRGNRRVRHYGLCPAPAPSGDLPASERQIAYALDLLARAGSATWADLNYPVPSAADVQQMRRAEISALISDLTTEL